MSRLPLSGYTVIALEQAVAAPLATRHLADWGARVIKIERPGPGDFARQYDTTVKGLSSHFVWLNRGKESLTLDLKHPEAQRILLRLIEGADVFIQNLAPGAAERLGLGAQALRELWPRLITCGISGYGSTGSYRDKKAYDLLIQAETGVINTTGTEESPAKIGISVADIAAGMYGYSGILTALLARERTGEGANLEVSLFEALGEWMSFPAYYTVYGGTPPRRSGAHHATIVPYGPFSVGDGSTVFIAIQNEREWVNFCDLVLGDRAIAADPRFCSAPLRLEHREEMHHLVLEVFARLTGPELAGRLERAQIAYSEMRSIQAFVDHPQLKERNRFRDIQSSAGPLWALLPPVTFEDIEPAMGPIPETGAHTDAILQELGYDRTSIAELRAAGAV